MIRCGDGGERGGGRGQIEPSSPLEKSSLKKSSLIRVKLIRAGVFWTTQNGGDGEVIFSFTMAMVLSF